MGSESRQFGLFKLGNSKLAKGTVIFNMGSATDCPSKARGLCRVCHLCYAHKAEMRWPAVLPFRRRQQKYWDNTPITGTKGIYWDIKRILEKREVIYFRYNEAGDFKNQWDVSKLNEIAKRLKYEYDIITYGYTARSDLNFEGVSFIVRGSGWKGPNGQTNVMHKKLIAGRKQIKGFKVCPAEGCGSTCKACMKPKGNVIFPTHGGGYK